MADLKFYRPNPVALPDHVPDQRKFPEASKVDQVWRDRPRHEDAVLRHLLRRGRAAHHGHRSRIAEPEIADVFYVRICRWAKARMEAQIDQEADFSRVGAAS